MWILVCWLLVGIYGLVENAELINTVEDKRRRLAGIVLIVVSTAIRIGAGIFDYLLEQVFDEWGEEDEDDTYKTS